MNSEINKAIRGICFHTIRKTSDPYWGMFLETYGQSFPVDEQRPVDSVVRLMAEDSRYEAMALLDGEEHRFLGLLTVWRFATFIYIEHLALSPGLRSCGYGSGALQRLIQISELPVVLEVEPPVDELTRRRVQFYKRNGLSLYDYDYMQPPYAPGRLSVALRLMGTLAAGTALSPIAQILWREVYGVSGNGE